ncbi:MAG: hypothetical protein GXP08_17315 [Gammaproteobacteria bacterium]|nr:hypothetical protein [Gammaproteobacteria bacterium]
MSARIVIAVVMLGIVLATGLNGAILCICAIGTLWLLRMLMIKRINGTTGDTAGTTVELTGWLFW